MKKLIEEYKEKKMPERIVKNKRKCVCRYCGKDITTDYKVRFKYDKRERKGRYYHLICYYKMALRKIKSYKEDLKEQNRIKRKMNNYKKHMIVENLE